MPLLSTTEINLAIELPYIGNRNSKLSVQENIFNLVKQLPQS